jgi:hypothetical protein
MLVEVTELKITGKDPKRLAEAEKMQAVAQAALDKGNQNK